MAVARRNYYRIACLDARARHIDHRRALPVLFVAEVCLYLVPGVSAALEEPRMLAVEDGQLLAVDLSELMARKARHIVVQAQVLEQAAQCPE